MKKTTTMIKRAIAMCMALVTVLSVLTICVSAEDAADEFKLLYESAPEWYEESPIAYVTGFEGVVPQTLVIPESYEGTPVIGIDTGAFRNCKTVEELVLPDGLNWIENRAFLNCTNLKTIRFGEQTNHIGSSAFENCVSLETLDLRNVLYITPYAFAGCSALRTISTKAVYIGEYAFDRCSCLEHVLITGYDHEYCGEDWTSVGNHHFYYADWEWTRYGLVSEMEYFEFDAAYDEVFTVEVGYTLSDTDTCYWYQSDDYGLTLYDADENKSACTCRADELGTHTVFAEVVDADGNIVYQEVNYVYVSYTPTPEQQLQNAARTWFRSTLLYRFLNLLMNQIGILRDLWLRYFA